MALYTMPYVPSPIRDTFLYRSETLAHLPYGDDSGLILVVVVVAAVAVVVFLILAVRVVFVLCLVVLELNVAVVSEVVVDCRGLLKVMGGPVMEASLLRASRVLSFLLSLPLCNAFSFLLLIFGNNQLKNVSARPISYRYCSLFVRMLVSYVCCVYVYRGYGWLIDG